MSSYIYLGIEGYGEINRTKALNPESEIYRFSINNEEKKFKIYPGDIINTTDTSPNYDKYKCEDDAYPIQNQLIIGYEYDLTIENNCIMGIKQITRIENKYIPPIKNTPGLRTLKNFILTSFQPLGTTLYVFGGGWDFQDVGTSNEGRTIGISQNWVKFFDEHNENYTFRDDNNKKNSYYPFGEYNLYYYAGLDCSGFVGWAIYNTLYNESLTNGFVMSSKNIAKHMSVQKYGEWMHNVEGSSFTNPDYILLTEELKVGDILSTNGHVMIVLGKCNDGSFIIIHSTPNNSKNNYPGGGVQISAVNPKGKNSQDCEAYRLCDEYMKKYFKKWSKRYDVMVTKTETVFNFDDKTPNTGLFHWDLKNGIITDPDHYSQKSAKEILMDLFEEKEEKKEEEEENNNNFMIIIIILALILLLIIIIVVLIIKLRKNNPNIENKETRETELVSRY